MKSSQSRNMPFLLKVFIQMVFILYALSILFVVYYMVSNGLKTQTDYALSTILPGSTIEWYNIYDVLFNYGLGKACINSFFYGTTTVILTLLISSFAAYAFTMFKFPGKNVIYWGIIATMYMSASVLIIPLYLQYVDLGINNTAGGMIILYTGTRIAFTTFMLTTYFRGISPNMFEAARIDGCGDIQMLFRLMLPLSKPILVTTVILNFASAWNDLIFSTIFLQDGELATVMKVVAGFKAGRYYVNYVYIFTSLAILVIPMIFIYLFGQKHFLSGIMSGSVKE